MPTYSSSTHSLDLDLRDTWGAGLVADLTLIPEQSLTGWTVTFDYPGDIVNIWNARIVSHVGDRYVVESVGYNNTVAAGGSVNFGFQGSGSVHDITPVALVGEPIGDSGDTPPSPIVSVSDASASEEAGSIEFVVSLSAPAATDVEVTYQTMAGTAEAGTDYSQRTATVTIPAGQTSSIVTISLINDASSETRESFSLELLSAVGADIGDGTATGTITDADIGAPDAIEVTVTGGSVTEADPGMAHMHDDGTSHMHDDGHRYITFMVALEGPAAEALSLTYETADGTAVADTTNTDAWDYHETTGTVTFAVGEQMKMITVAVHPDVLVEETETFTFTVSGDNITGTLSATGSIYDNDTAASDDDSGEDGRPGGGDSSGFVGGGTTYAVGSVQAVSDFDPARDILDLGGSSIHNQIPVDTAEGFMMVNMFNSGQSLLVEGVWLEDLHPENFTPISDAHLQQDLSAILAYEDGSGFVRPNTIYVRSHQEGLVETVDFDPATDKISFFYLSVRGDGELNFSVEQTAQGVRFFSPITGQSLTLRNITFDDLNSNHFEWRANQLEDNVAGRMNLSGQIDGFQIITDNVFSGKSVAMAGGVDRAPYHSVQGYEEYSGTPIGATDNDTGGGGDSGGDDMGTTPVTVTVTGGSVTEADPGMAHMHEDGASHMHDDGHRYITFQIALDAPAAEALTLNYATADGTAIADTTSDVAWDYHTATGTVTFAVGEQLKTVAVAVHPDELVEDTETFSFTVSGDNIIGTLEATGTIYDDDTADDDGSGGDGGGTDGGGDTGTGPFVGGGTTYQIGTQPIINGFDPTRDVLDLGGDSIHNQIPVDTPDGFMMLHMFNASKSTLVEGVSLADLSPENFAPIADSHLQQDLSAALAWDDGSGLVRPDTVYVRSHQQGLEQIVDFEPVTDKISFFYLSVRGDGELNFSVEQTDAGVRFFSTLTGQSLTLRDITFDDLNSNHFEWRANQLEDNVAGRMNLSGQIDGFQIVSENVFSGKSVAMAGGVDRAPYHSQPDYSGTPIGQVGDPSNPDTVVPDPVDESGGGSSGGSGGSSGGSGGGSNVAATSGLVAPEIVASWGGGYNVETAFTPDVSVNGWTVQLRLSGEIVNIWNAEIAARDGDIYTFVSLGYNASLAAGETTGFGFQVSGGPASVEVIGQESPVDAPMDDPVDDQVDDPMDDPVDDPTPPAPPAVLSVSGQNVSEGDSGAKNVTFTLTLTEAKSSAISVDYMTADGAAEAGTDFTANSGTVTFAPGETSKTVTIAVLGDTDVEGDEDFSLMLSNLTGDAIFGSDEASAIITNDDVTPAPAPEDDDVSVSFAVRQSWNGGFVGDLTITNDGDMPLTDWDVSFDGDFTIGDIWGAQIVEDGGGRYTLVGAGWTESIAPGQQVTFGFVGRGGAGPESLTALTLNGMGDDAPDMPDISDTPEEPASALPRMEEDLEATLYHVDDIKSGAFGASPNPEFPEITSDTVLVQSNDFGQTGHGGHNWGGINPNMYRGFDYAGRDREIGESIGNGPTIMLNSAMSTQELENAINGAPIGAIVEFQAGTYWLTETINISRGDIHIKGVSESEVILRADAITSDAAIRIKEGSINGKLGENEAELITNTQSSVSADVKVVQLKTVEGIEAGDFLEFVYNYNNEVNSRAFDGSGGSFDKISSLVEVDSVDAVTNEVTLKEKVGMDFDPNRDIGNAEVRVFDGEDFIHNLIISDLTIKYIEDDDYAAIVDPHDLFNYNNSNYGGAYDHKVAGIRLEAVHESDILNVTIENAGSMGIWIDAGYQIGVRDFTFDGSQNLGGGGNGYGMLLDDSFYGDFEGLTIGAVDEDGQIAASRHAVVMGYSSSAAYNNIHYAFVNSNLDHHGGLDFGNISYVETMAMTHTDHYNFGAMDDRYVLDGLHYNQIQNTYVFDDVLTQNNGPIPNYVGSLVPGQEDGQGHWANNGIGSSVVDRVFMSANGGTAQTFGEEDEIHSGVGDDAFWGGDADDIFVFYDNSGADIIHDFEGGDRIAIQKDINGSGFATGAAALASLEQVGSDARLDLGAGNSVTLLGAQVSEIDASDFLVF